MNTGSCLCGSVTFTVSGELKGARYCHCQKCRKFSGSMAGSWATTEVSQFAHAASADAVGKFDSGKGRRCFCNTCGSPVWFESKDFPNLVVIPLGALDDADFDAPSMHIFTADKATWSTIDDELEQFRSYPK